MPTVNGKSSISGYSGKAIKPVALRFVQQMRDGIPGVAISGIGGIETWEDAAEFILLGATTLQVTTAIMQYGYRIVEDMKNGLMHYMDEQGVDRLQDLVGDARERSVDLVLVHADGFDVSAFVHAHPFLRMGADSSQTLIGVWCVLAEGLAAAI